MEILLASGGLGNDEMSIAKQKAEKRRREMNRLDYERKHEGEIIDLA
jgi:hypothetical protein